MGRISANGTQYYYESRFWGEGGFYTVFANLDGGADIFTIYRDED